MFKKITAVLLSAIFILVIFSSIGFAVDGEAETEGLSSAEFMESLSSLMNQYDANSFETSSGGDIETCRIIVKTAAGQPLTDYQGAAAIIEDSNSVHFLQYTNSAAAQRALDFYKAQDFVEYAEKDEYIKVCGGSSDGAAFTVPVKLDSPLSWGTQAVHFDELNEQIENEKLIKSKEEIVVAVFDTGLTSEHVHFAGSNRIEPGSNAIFGGQDTSEGSSDGHGTHIAGTILDNTLPQVKVRPYRVDTHHGLDPYTSLGLIGASIYLAVENGDDVINVSMDWGACGSDYINGAIDFAYSQNVPVIAAAGNDYIGDGNDACTVFPANKENAITVAAINDRFEPMLKEDNKINCSTNYGSCVDIAAPGGSILGPVYNKNQYNYFSGSSQAAAYVSAAVATIKLVYPDITCEGIWTLLEKSVCTPDWWDTENYGVGILNCKNLLSAGMAAKPVFSVNASGELVITSPSDDAVIYYTTDNSTPVAGESQLYTAPINTVGVKSVKAVAYEDGKVVSTMATYTLEWISHIKIDYKEIQKLNLPEDTKVISCVSSDTETVTVDAGEMTICGVSKGEAKVTVYLNNNRRAVYYVTVDYSLLQWIIIIVLWGFWWYI